MPPLLIIVSGLPCTGKTTVAITLAQHLRMPFLSKDAVKEVLFDTLGWADREWSKKLSQASNAILLQITGVLLEIGGSVLLESNFDNAQDTPQLQKLIQKFSTRTVQIHCTAEPTVIEARFRHRVETASRHPGHVDSMYLPDLQKLTGEGQQQALDLSGTTIELDTTRGNVDYPGLLAAIGA